jgi:hypothetical protein
MPFEMAFGFLTAEKITQKLGFAENSPRKADAEIILILSENDMSI